MNTTGDVVKHTVDALRGAPTLLAILILNLVVLGGFAYTLHEISGAMERRESILKACLDGSGK